METTQQYPVSAQYTPEGWSTPGIAFEDYSRMATVQHKQCGERQLPTPTWALNEPLMRKLLVRYLEERAGCRNPWPGSDAERMARAKKTIAVLRSRKIEVLKGMCQRYVGMEPRARKTQACPVDRKPRHNNTYRRNHRDHSCGSHFLLLSLRV
jgi:hypothetical protein